MQFHFEQVGRGKAPGNESAFTLAEVLVSFLIFGMVVSGLIYGYIQSNRMAEWSSMSLAAQSYAQQGAEMARAADWRPRDYPPATGAGTMDELPATTNGLPARTNSDFMDIPIKGVPTNTDFPYWMTNYVYVTTISANPALRQIRSDAQWEFARAETGTNRIFYTNTVILLRAPDQ
jgi:Tfp pilus assembly protein PilV